MRESIGGTMLFWIVLFFLSIFIFFLAFVMKYAYAYRIKNSIINYIEREEGIESVEDFRNKLTELGYSEKSPCSICKNTSGRGVYYSVTLNADLEIPIVYVKVPVFITGETRTIKTGLIAEQSRQGDGSSQVYEPGVEMGSQASIDQINKSSIPDCSELLKD